LAGGSRPGLWLALFAVLTAGCAHSRSNREDDAAIQEILAAKPPVFLTGPMAALLTNRDGFSARVAMELPPNASAPGRVSGQLFGRGGKLFFAPDATVSASKRHPGAGITFIWDVAAGSGYMMSDPMQSYAPIGSGVRVTNVVFGPGGGEAEREKMGGHPSQRGRASVLSSDGTAATFQVWRATDLEGLAVRIVPATNATFVAVDLSGVKLETPPGESFQPPAGFTRYDTAAAMINEMLARRQSLRQAPGRTLEEPDFSTGRQGGPGR
jgi:hypothetical protein